MGSTQKIGVVGCGIGGLAVAGFLTRQGHDVTIFDQFSAPAPVGSGLVIQPIGQAVLQALGAGEQVHVAGAPLNQMIGIEADSGRRVLNVGYGKDRYGLGIHRASLFDAVLQAATAQGARIVANAKITGTTIANNQRYLQISGGQSAGPFDLVIDASGAGSVLSPMQATPLAYGALWGVVDTPDDTSLRRDVLAQCYRKASSMVGALPIGYLPDDPNHKTAVFWSLPADKYKDWQAQPITAWQDEARQLWPEFTPFAEQITQHTDMTMARYAHGNLRNPVMERLVFIGDAAHRASPQLGQGANMALLDAYVLADAIAHFELQDALAQYAHSRRWHVRVYQAISWAFTPMYQSDSKILPFIRDWVLRPASFVPPVPWLLRQLVCGEFVPPGKLPPFQPREQ